MRLVAGPGVAQVWSSSPPVCPPSSSVAPSRRRRSPPASDFETVRNYLLLLPGLPDDVAAQLRTFTSDGSTLPLPVPSDQVDTSSAQVNGETATVLAARDKTMAAVVWVDDGAVNVVAGSLDTDEVLAVARGLQ